MRSTILIGLAVWLITCSIAAEDEARYVEAATKFIAKHGSTDAEKKWEKKWKSLAETAINDNPDLDEEKYLNRYIYDWMAGRATRFEKNELTVDDKLQACRLYMLYKNRRWKIPDSISKHLTKDNLERFIVEDKSLAKKNDREVKPQ